MKILLLVLVMINFLLSQVTFKVVIIESEPYCYYYPEDKTYDGVVYSKFKDIMDSLNISLSYVNAPNSQAGLKMLKNGKIDVMCYVTNDPDIILNNEIYLSNPIGKSEIYPIVPDYNNSIKKDYKNISDMIKDDVRVVYMNGLYYGSGFDSLRTQTKGITYAHSIIDSCLSLIHKKRYDVFPCDGRVFAIKAYSGETKNIARCKKAISVLTLHLAINKRIAESRPFGSDKTYLELINENIKKVR